VSYRVTELMKREARTAIVKTETFQVTTKCGSSLRRCETETRWQAVTETGSGVRLSSDLRLLIGQTQVQTRFIRPIINKTWRLPASRRPVAAGKCFYETSVIRTRTACSHTNEQKTSFTATRLYIASYKTLNLSEQLREHSHNINHTITPQWL